MHHHLSRPFEQRWPCASTNAFSVDEFVGTVSQGSPECLRGNRWADGFDSRWDSQTERQPRRGDIFVESAMEMNSSSVRSGICRPDGAGELGGVRGYKDFAPDGAIFPVRITWQALINPKIP